MSSGTLWRVGPCPACCQSLPSPTCDFCRAGRVGLQGPRDWTAEHQRIWEDIDWDWVGTDDDDDEEDIDVDFLEELEVVMESKIAGCLSGAIDWRAEGF